MAKFSFAAILLFIGVAAAPAFAACGDTVLDGAEQCDDGNTSNGDGCDAACLCDLTGSWRAIAFGGATTAYVTVTESAGGVLAGVSYPPGSVHQAQQIVGSRSGQDVTLFNLAGSHESCDTVLFQLAGGLLRLRTTYCGDGAIQADEVCDDGNWVNGDGCNVDCSLPACGNGVVETGAGEGCDDHNLFDGDGCSSVCLQNTCGNNIIESGEQCDDGNVTDGDGCTHFCQIQVCGNGAIELGEDCDDTNTTNGDGCSASCLIEGCDVTGTWDAPGISAVTPHLIFTLIEGPGGVVSGLYYSPGNPATTEPVSGTRNGGHVHLTVPSTTIPIDGVMNGCSGHIYDTIFGTMLRTRSTYCGDGTIDPEEVCDDGNLNNIDGCHIDCSPNHCGDHIVDPDESCDDGNSTNGDGCSTTCKVNVCGNDTLESGEQCDDHNTTNGDGCTSLCQLQTCGNGIVEPGESCDDSNTTSGDGCSHTCQFEGCDLTGTWGVPFYAPTVLTLVEGAGGTITGLMHTGSPGSARPVTGTRSGTNVTLVNGSVTYTGQMSSCTFVPLSGGVIVRQRTTYCGDGGLQGAEICDDGNFLSGDACDVTCTGAGAATCGNGLLDAGEACDDGNGSDQDVCKRSCTANVCGDGAVRSGVEACDDGNVLSGDGCAADCLSIEPETVPPTAVGGGVTTVSTGAVATPADPIETTIAVPAGTVSGSVSITESAAPPAPTTGFVLLGTVIDIVVSNVDPPPSANDPLVFSFRLDASQIPTGQTKDTLTVTKDGAVLGPCPALPTACVAQRILESDGDVTLVVHTLSASAWGIAASVCPTAPDPTCAGAVSGKAKLSLKSGTKPKLGFQWKGVGAVTKAQWGAPLTMTAYTVCLYQAGGLSVQATAPAGGLCPSKACWKESNAGWKYTNPSRFPQGLVAVALKAGAAGKVTLGVKGDGALLAFPTLPLAAPAAVQVRSADGACFGASFSAPKKNDGRSFVAKSD